MKKAVSFIIILLSVGALAYIFLTVAWGGSLLPGETSTDAWESSHAVDRSGNLYFVQKEQESVSLVSLDSTGRRVYRRDITADVTLPCVFDDLFVDQDKNLYLTTYSLVPDTSVIRRVSIFRYREDGSFVGRIFQEDIVGLQDGKFRLISAMSDDDAAVYFGLLRETGADLYAYAKTGENMAVKTGAQAYPADMKPVNTFYVLPSGDTIFSLEGGTLLKTARDGTETRHEFGAGVIVDRIWFAGIQFYFRDAASGTVYVSSAANLDPAVAIGGTETVEDDARTLFRQLDPVAIGNVGNVMGILQRDGTSRIFLGGFAFLPDIGSSTGTGEADLLRWLLLAGIAAGCLILTLLLWEFYCSFLNMRMPLLLRQGLLVVLVVFLSLYFLINRIIVPQSQQMLQGVDREDRIRAGQSFIAAFRSHSEAAASGTAEATEAAAFFLRYRDNLQAGLPGLRSGNPTDLEMAARALDTSHFCFFTGIDGEYRILASTDRYEPGFPAVRLGYGTGMILELADTARYGTLSFEAQTRKGRELCVLMPTSMTYGGSPVLLGVLTGLDARERNTSAMVNTVSRFLVFVGLALVLLMLLVEVFTVYNLRKLERGVHRIAAGEYGGDIGVRSGDEIEDLSNSIQALSLGMKDTRTSLNLLNASYHRFVPERFLEMIGETHIEKVGKQSQAYKENAILLFLRFRFLSSAEERSEEIFASINTVFEAIAPVAGESGGTVYNFMPDGFNAVFEGGTEAVLRTALRMREVMHGLNARSREEGRGEVDIRLFLTRGNLMMGFIGEEKRMEPAAVTNEARKAEPLLQLCFDSDIHIACTLEVLESLPVGVYRNRLIGEVMVREERVALYDLFDSDPYDLVKAKETFADRFELGVRLFTKMDNANARNMFMEILKNTSLDGAARNYMYITEYNLRAGTRQSTYTTIRELERTR